MISETVIVDTQGFSVQQHSWCATIHAASTLAVPFSFI